ncbi:hypothetical protein RvY_12792 [Ramazzottius varieornatus]|uniref:Gustatory receptor n=1 Tax=Ramazzottius varieornatus TaxID=947166 RepID=A0A1D1VMZ9_RAMVA|nr:hypothetical protein RvY_12792 [Ramazzottius varieornatus]
MQALTQIPFATYNFRGVIILTILLFKRKQWTEFLRLIDGVLLETFPVVTSKVSKTVRVWKVISFGGAVLTLFMVVTFETLNDLQYGLMTNRGLYDTGVLDPLPLYMLVWQYDTFWTVCSTLPFYLSQQMAICIYITGQILADCCKNLNHALKDETKTLVIEPRDALHDLYFSRTQKIIAEIFYPDPTERVVILKQRYLNLCHVCEYMNEHFGAILFFLYGLDLLTMCGVIASIVEGFDNGIMLVKAYYYVTTIIFLIHCTLFLWPLVRANEQSLRVNGSLHQLIEKAEVIGSLNSSQGRAFHSILQTFIQVSKDQLIMFSGAEILHFTRHFIFTTFTLLISFIVICKEVLQRDEMEAKASSVSGARAPHDQEMDAQVPHRSANAVRPRPLERHALLARNFTQAMAIDR